MSGGGVGTRILLKSDLLAAERDWNLSFSPKSTLRLGWDGDFTRICEGFRAAAEEVYAETFESIVLAYTF